MRPGRRAPRALAAAAVLATALAGCTPGESEPLPSDLREPGSAGSASPPAEELQRFHDQELSWSDCDGGECATLTVPVDYDDPSGPTMELALLRHRAGDEDRRIGSLVVNPGGPGSSGVDYAQAADTVVSPSVRKVYDVVGFDPRGVARSEGVDCVEDEQLDALLGADPEPDDARERREGEQVRKAFVNGCTDALGDRIGAINTADAARDMDVLRSALGDSRLNYLGLSYGTQLGATYAEEFPDRVGAFVLDGVLPTDLDAVEIGLGQARGFERATRSYLEWCTQEGDCPLGETPDEAADGLRELLRAIDEEPPRVRADARVDDLDVGWATYGLAAAMYDEAGWQQLTKALRRAQDGDGQGLMELANGYADRQPDGSYDSNLMEAFHVYTCNDRALGGRSEAEVRKAYEKAAPLWGDFLMGEGSVCDDWPVDPAEPFEAKAKGSEPILVVGTTRDPATPLEWAEDTAQGLDNGHLLTRDGDGHTAYRRGSECVDEAVDAYLLSGTVPEGDAARCE
ncbi:alpha/beta hydrolase [Kytococcus sp. Marseille-QA3725]